MKGRARCTIVGGRVVWRLDDCESTSEKGKMKVNA
jgi:hypothetical protein